MGARHPIVTHQLDCHTAFPDLCPMSRQRPFTERQVDHIGKAARLLCHLFEQCGDLRRRRNWKAIAWKAAELAENNDAIRRHFGHNNLFLEKINALAWTEKFLGNLWNRHILLHTNLVPDRELDETDCTDTALTLSLAITLWHETAHWEGAQDSWIEVEEFRILRSLEGCAHIQNHPCGAALLQTIAHQKRTARNDDGWWHGF